MEEFFHATLPHHASGTPETVRFVILGLLPEAYAKAATSGFRATVVPGRNAGESFTFRLSSDHQAAADR